MEWGDFLNTTAQEVVGMKVNQLKPTTPVSTGQGGTPYEEGQPAAGTLASIPKVYLIGAGVAFALLIAFVALRK